MKLKEYQEKAKRTLADLGSDKLNLSHMVMGMCTELPELENAITNDDKTNIGEELADIFWYVANYESCRNYELDKWDVVVGYHNITGISNLYYSIALLQDMIKKYIAYNKDINIEEEKQLLAIIKINLINIFNDHNLNEEEYLQKNIDKLKARYPEKFTEHDAVNRDLDKERKILES